MDWTAWSLSFFQCGVVTQSEAVFGGVETDGPAAALFRGQTNGTQTTTRTEDARERGQRTTACRQLWRGRPLSQLNGKAVLRELHPKSQTIVFYRVRRCPPNHRLLKIVCQRWPDAVLFPVGFWLDSVLTYSWRGVWDDSLLTFHLQLPRRSLNLYTYNLKGSYH